VVLLCKPKRTCPNETSIFLANDLFSISTGEISGKKGRDTCALYVPIDMKSNQKGTMDREWGIDNFRLSAGGSLSSLWFLDQPWDRPEGLQRRMVLGSLGTIGRVVSPTFWFILDGKLEVVRDNTSIPM